MASPTGLLAASRNTIDTWADTDDVSGETRPPKASFNDPESIWLVE
jgi:hypothetical protein